MFAPLTDLNPATLFPDPDLEPPIHDHQQVLTETHGWHKDLSDAEKTWFTDGSSYLEKGQRRAGTVVVDGQQVVWAQTLPEGTSAQKAELIALTKALELGEGKKINIYTDSGYAFAVAQVHGAIYLQRGLLTSGGKEIKNKPEILALPEVLYKPAKVSIIHCPDHQKSDSFIAQGNNLADQEAKAAASRTTKVMVARESELPEIKFQYTTEDLAVISRDPENRFDQRKGVWVTPSSKKNTTIRTGKDNDKTNVLMDPSRGKQINTNCLEV